MSLKLGVVATSWAADGLGSSLASFSRSGGYVYDSTRATDTHFKYTFICAALLAVATGLVPAIADMATTWGNYTNYSGPSKSPGLATHFLDPRLHLLQTLVPGIFSAKACLDIGCNAGSVSCQLAFDFHAASVTGVDIDPDLITQAENLLALRASRVRPPTDYSARSIDYFPISAVLSHGYRIEPKSKLSRTASPASALPIWPAVNFFAADWVVSLNQDTSGPYHVILALSVIKWIHLEHLDSGLRAFFKKCSQSLHPGGYLIIELQTWDSYEKAIRPKTAPHFSQNLQKLQYRPETSFNKLLAGEGLSLYKSSTALARRIDVYCKTDNEASCHA